MVGTLSLGPQSEIRDVWQNLQDVGYCFELTTVTDSGQVKTNIFMVRDFNDLMPLLMAEVERLAGPSSTRSCDGGGTQRPQTSEKVFYVRVYPLSKSVQPVGETKLWAASARSLDTTLSAS